jgi:hypothetical protein
MRHEFMKARAGEGENEAEQRSREFRLQTKPFHALKEEIKGPRRHKKEILLGFQYIIIGKDAVWTRQGRGQGEGKGGWSFLASSQIN